METKTIQTDSTGKEVKSMANPCQILQGDWIEVLKTLPDASVQMVCTSPPYW